jgi:predicted permease
VADLTVACRQLWRRPVFTLTAVLTLAIGIGVNVVAFSVVNGLLLKDSWLRATDDFGRIATTPGGDESGYASLGEYERFQEATRGAIDMAAEGRLSVAWRHDAVTETAWVLFVTADYFSLVEARPLAGRIEVAASPGATPSVVVGERFWRRKLNGAPLSGLTLRLNETTVAVAGILPEAFRARGGIYAPDVWLPLEELAAFRTSPALQRADTRWLFAFGRLRPGVTVPEIQGRLDAAVASMARDWPDTHRDRGARFRLFREGNSELRGLSTAAAVLMGIIGLVLLLACFNVATLLLARAVERERDIGIRVALGAGTWRMVRLVTLEGFLIAGLAGAASLVLASWTQALVGSFAIPIEQPQYIDLSPNWRVVAFVAVLVLVAGILPGLWPAITAARVDVVRALGAQGGTSASGRPSPARRWLVGAQVAGSTAFLAIAALFIQSYGALLLVDVGFDRAHLVVAEVEPGAHGYTPEQSRRYARALLARLRALPGVAAAAVGDRAPFFVGYDRMTAISTAAAPCPADDCATYATVAIGEGYFQTLGVGLAAGREPHPAAESAEALVNEPLARRLWPDGRGLGEVIHVGPDRRALTVVGITARTRTRTLDREQPTLYVPLRMEHFGGELTIVARTTGSPALVVRPLVEAAQEVDSRVALLSAKTMAQRMAVPLWPFRTISWLFSICGALALVLATVGLAGVVIHAVNCRRREFGVRLSIGATPRDLIADVLRGSTRLLVPGLIVGILLAAGSARLMQAAFVGVDVLDPLPYVLVAIAECAVVGAASVGPALRASRVDPLVALRPE